MIIDGHLHIAASPDDGGFHASTLDVDTALVLMDGPFEVLGGSRGIDRALIQPMIAGTRAGDPADHHEYILRSVLRHPDRFTGCFVVNPLLPTDRTIEVLRGYVEQGNFRAMKLHPSLHGYMPFKTRDRLDPILQEAERLGIPVLVHQGDPPFSYPAQLATLIEAFPKVPFILCHFATQRVVLADEAIYVARKNPNVYIETGWGALPRLKEGIDALGPHRFVFGSDCPIQEMGSQLRIVDVLSWDEPMGIHLPLGETEAIMGDNLARLLKL